MNLFSRLLPRALVALSMLVASETLSAVSTLR